MRPGATSYARPWMAAACAVWLVFAVWSLTADPLARTTTAVADITETLVTLICLSVVKRSVSGQLPEPWPARASWRGSVGQAVWTWYETNALSATAIRGCCTPPAVANTRSWTRTC